MDVWGDVIPLAADTPDHPRPVGVLLGHDYPMEEVRVAAEQEAVRQEVTVDQLRPVSVLQVRIAAEQEAVLPEVNVTYLWPVDSLPLLYSLITLFYFERQSFPCGLQT